MQVMIIIFLCIWAMSNGFVIPPVQSISISDAVISLVPICGEKGRPLGGKADSHDAGDLSDPERTVFNILEHMHESGFSFRVIVIGTGAILETETSLGPKMSLSRSPKTGENLLTLAEEDGSFEFHVKLAQVSKIVMAEKPGPTPGKLLRIVRFLTAEGNPVCSFVLDDISTVAEQWYNSMVKTYGTDIQL